jgi:hypothetical protein
MRKQSYCQLLGTLGLLVLLLGSEGCLVVPGRQTQVRAPGGSGELSDIKKILKTKSVTRDKIRESLDYLDTGLGDSAFFWGRWNRISELQIVPLMGGVGGVVGSFSQHPFVENLVVEFDKDGHILQWKIVRDDHLLGRLVPLLRRAGDIKAHPAQVPPRCAFRWNQLTLVTADPPNSSIRSQTYNLIRLKFFVAQDKKKAACSYDASPEVAYAIFVHLISNGQDSLLK